ncbi:hypothetical protein FOCC_FOCC001359 [Frankliniella occidentalis]|nr:hypothetical protein FOCC_FOCC001359 [Frankliniella occidentalis]
MVPLLVFAAVPSAPDSSLLSDELSDSPRYMHMPSLMEDEAVERSDSFYRPAMTAQEKEAFYKPIARPSARDAKKSNKVRDNKWSKTVPSNEVSIQDASHASQPDRSVATDSGYHQTITDDTSALRQHWAELQSMKIKCEHLESERNALQDALADALSQLQEKQAGNAEVCSLRKQNSQLEEDVLLLKSTVYRLNAELEKYQNRLRALRKAHEAAGHVVSKLDASETEVKPTPMASNMLGPLLEAYQETILEKESALELSNRELSTSTQQCQSAKQEVRELKRRLESSTQVKNEELSDLQEKLEEAQTRSDSLLQNLESERSRLQEIQRQHQQEVSLLDGRARGLEAKLNECHTELLTLRGRYSVLSEQFERLQQGADRLIPLSVHNSAVNECKRLNLKL